MNIDLSLIKEKKFVQTEWFLFDNYRELNNRLLENRPMSNTEYHEVCLIQAYACSKTIPVESKHFKHWDVAKRTLNSENSEEIVVQWLKKALHYALVQNHSQGVYNVSIAFLDIFNERLFTQSKAVLDFGLSIANAMDNSKNHPDWTITYNMTLAYALVKSGTPIDEAWKHCSKLIAVSSQICKQSGIPVRTYMKYIGLIYHKVHNSKCIWPGATKALGLYFEIESLIHFGKGDLSQIITALKKLNNTVTEEKPSDIYLDHLWIHFELFQYTTSKGLIPECRALLEELQRFKIVNPEYIAKKKLLYQLIKIKKILERGLSIPKLESYIYHISNDIIAAFEHGWESLGIEISISLWNIILPYADQLPKKLVQKLTSVIEKSFAKIRHFNHDIKQVVKSEMKKFKRYSTSFISTENNLAHLIESHMIEDENEKFAEMFKKVSELLYMAESSDQELVQILLQKALLEVLPSYNYTEHRFLYPDQCILVTECAYYPVLFEFFKRCQKFCTKLEQSHSSNPFLWDMLFVSAMSLINLIQTYPLEIGDEDEFEFYFTLINTMLVGFKPQVGANELQKFAEYVLKLNLNLLEISKKKKLNYMEYNSGVQFWKSYVISYEKSLYESWIDPVNKFYEYFNESHLKKSNLATLISKIYAVVQLDIYFVVAAKNVGIKNSKDSSAIFLKNAEECLKMAATSKSSDMRTLLILIPIWNKVQQAKTPTATTNIPPLEFDMPEVKLWYQFDQAPKNDPKQAQKDPENLEILVANVLNHKNVPLVLKIKMLSKLAKMAIDYNQTTISFGLYAEGLAIATYIAKMKQYDTIDALATYNACHTIECLNGLEVISHSIPELHKATLKQLYNSAKDVTILNAKISLNSLMMVLGSYWNIVFHDLKQTDSISFDILSLILTRVTYIFGPIKIQSQLREEDAKNIRIIFNAVIDYHIDLEQLQLALKFVEMAAKILPKSSLAPIWARKYNIHRELGASVDYIIPVNYEPNYYDLVAIASLVKHPDDKLLMYQKANKLIITAGLKSEATSFRLRQYYENYDNKNLKLEQDGNIKDSKTPYDMILAIHTMADAITQDSVTFKESLDAMNGNILEMMQVLYAVTSKNAPVPDIVPQTKPKSEKGKKGTTEPVAASEVSEVTIPAAWDNYVFPKSVKHQFQSKSTESISKGTVQRPVKLILDLIKIVDANIELSITENIPILLKVVELICDSFNPIYPILSYFPDLISAFTFHKCNKTQHSNDCFKQYMAKYNDYFERALYIEESINQVFIEESEIVDLHLIAIDYLIEFTEFTAALNNISLVLHGTQNKQAESSALFKLALIHLMNNNCRDALGYSQKGIRMVSEGGLEFYKFFSLQYIATTQMFENHLEKKLGIAQLFITRIDKEEYIHKAIVNGYSKSNLQLICNWCLFYLKLSIYMEKATGSKYVLKALQQLDKLLDSDHLRNIADECVTVVLQSTYDHSFLTPLYEPQIIGFYNNSGQSVKLKIAYLVFKSIQTIRFYFKPQVDPKLQEINPVELYLKNTDPENVEKVLKEINPMESLTTVLDSLEKTEIPEHLKCYYDFCQAIQLYLKALMLTSEESRATAEKAISIFNTLVDIFTGKEELYLLRVVGKCTFMLYTNILKDQNEAAKYLFLAHSCDTCPFVLDVFYKIRRLPNHLLRKNFSIKSLGISEEYKFLKRKQGMLLSKDPFPVHLLQPKLTALPTDLPKGTAIFTICASTEKLKLFISATIKKQDMNKGAEKKKTPEDAFIVETLIYDLNEHITPEDIENALQQLGLISFLRDVEVDTDKATAALDPYQAVLLLDSITETIYIEDIILNQFKKIKSVTRDFSVGIFMNRKKVEPPQEAVKKKEDTKAKKDKDKKKEEETIPGKMNDIFIITSKLTDNLDDASEKFKRRDMGDAMYEDLEEMCKSQMFLFAGVSNPLDIFCGPFVSGILGVALTFQHEVPKAELTFDYHSKVKAAIFTIYGILSYVVPCYCITEPIALKIIKNIQLELKNGGGDICQLISKANTFETVKLTIYGQNVPCHI
ncbi:hypothetical protein HDV04_000096 [Boothiomyces sp. JEL0838]|nr:hypothetical protein HDV04_000096 [Boothiomyces sp. JEL0838]